MVEESRLIIKSTGGRKIEANVYVLTGFLKSNDIETRKEIASTKNIRIVRT